MSSTWEVNSRTQANLPLPVLGAGPGSSGCGIIPSWVSALQPGCYKITLAGITLVGTALDLN